MSISNELDATASEAEANDDYYLELSPEPVKFEPVNDVTDVFFDDSKQQVCLDKKQNFVSILKNLCLTVTIYRCLRSGQEVLQVYLLRVPNIISISAWTTKDLLFLLSFLRI